MDQQSPKSYYNWLPRWAALSMDPAGRIGEDLTFTQVKRLLRIIGAHLEDPDAEHDCMDIFQSIRGSGLEDVFNSTWAEYQYYCCQFCPRKKWGLDEILASGYDQPPQGFLIEDTGEEWFRFNEEDADVGSAFQGVPDPEWLTQPVTELKGSPKPEARTIGNLLHDATSAITKAIMSQPVRKE